MEPSLRPVKRGAQFCQHFRGKIWNVLMWGGQFCEWCFIPWKTVVLHFMNPSLT